MRDKENKDKDQLNEVNIDNQLNNEEVQGEALEDKVELEEDNTEQQEETNIENKEDAKKKGKKLSITGSLKGAKKSLKTTQWRNGSFMTASTCIVIAIILVFNLVVAKLGITFDLTKDKIYSLSDQTVERLNSLEQEVTITILEDDNYSNELINNIVKKYKEKSDKIKVKTVDPVVNPSFIATYSEKGEEITVGNLIIESGSKYRVVSERDMYEIDYYQGRITGVNVEQEVTSAIDYVTNENLPIAYILEGHNEGELPTHITDALQKENYTVQNLNLLSGEKWSYGSSDVLIINAPGRDLSNEEYEMLMSYFKEGGSALVLVEHLPENMENFKKLFEYYGISVGNEIVFEGEASMAYRSPLNIIPNIGSHYATSPLIDAKLPVLMPTPQRITINELTRSTLKIQPLFTTSNNAYAKTGTELNTFEKENGDIEGPFNLGVAISEEVEGKEGEGTKIVVVGSSQMLDAQIINLTKGGNLDFVMNSINWLSEREENISIRAKAIAPEQIMITESQLYMLALVSMIIIPLGVCVIGAIVCYRRKHL